MDLRRDGQLVDGVEIGDMGIKTTGNDLDNAWIQFTDVRLPKEAMLNRYADIVDDAYVQKVSGTRTMDMIGQRLYTGRVAVAQAALTFRRELFDRTRAYADSKRCWAPSGEPVLSGMPHLKALFDEAEAEAAAVESFVASCEAELGEGLKADVIPPTELTEAIAVCKVRAVETSIELCFRLKQEVGSFALMGDSGFAHQDFLQCCKFAEGDSRILMQKMARDQLRAFQKGAPLPDAEKTIATRLAQNMAKEVEASGDKQKAWDDNWKDVYELANGRSLGGIVVIAACAAGAGVGARATCASIFGVGLGVDPVA